jgi:MFS-type transporter involved in bile tolerance (Atg22 family)
MTLILAWLTRRVHSDYSESKSLATFAGIVAIVLVILVPLSLTLGDESDSQIIRFVIQSEFILIIVVSSLGLLFIPKTIMIFRNR